MLEGSQYFRGKHKTMLANLMDLEAITVDDVMTPRSQIHALDLDREAGAAAPAARHVVPLAAAGLRGRARQHRRRAAAQERRARLHQTARSTPSACAPLLRPPYFVPVGTPLLTQLQQFQADRQRLGLVVDEYGELQGLVTIEDIVEEIIGEFTTQAPGGADSFRREADGSVVVDGMALLRTLNRRLGTQFPPGRPENAQRAHRRASGRHSGRRASASSVDGQGVEILQTQDRAVKVVRLLPPVGRAAAPLQSPGRAGIIVELSFMQLE